MAPPSTTVWLVEDNASFRQAVARALTGKEGISCPHGFGSVEEALEALEHEEKPDVILLDVGLPGMSGIEGLRPFYERAPDTRILILTVFEDSDKIFQAVCAGASGYLLKSASGAEIAEAIHQVQSGGAPMSPKVARLVLELFSRLPPSTPADYGLTAREKEILQLMVKGLIKKEIGAQISLSVHTVDSHLRKIYQKLHVTTRTGAVAKAVKERLF